MNQYKHRREDLVKYPTPFTKSFLLWIVLSGLCIQLSGCGVSLLRHTKNPTVPSTSSQLQCHHSSNPLSNQSLSLWIEPNTGTAHSGDSVLFSLWLKAENIPKVLSGLEAKLTWNSDALEYLNYEMVDDSLWFISGLSFNVNGLNNDTQDGDLYFSAVVGLLSTVNVTQAGLEVARLQFQVKPGAHGSLFLSAPVEVINGSHVPSIIDINAEETASTICSRAIKIN